MAVEAQVFEDTLASMRSDPGYARFIRPDSAVLMVDRDGERLLWASPAAAPLAEALGTEDGALDPAGPAAALLRSLARGLASRGAARLERIRLDASRIAPPSTFACGLVDLPSGEPALLAILIGPMPKLTRKKSAPPPEVLPETEPARAPDGAGPAETIVAAGPPVTPPDPEPPRDLVAHLRGRGTIRFIWQADPEGRFTFVSDSLAGIVGERPADILGRTWPDIEGRLVEDPSGSIAGLFSRRETWSGRTVLWRIAGGDWWIGVDLAGLPVHGRDRQLLGFRGFGLLRTAEIVERPQPAGASRAGDVAAPLPSAPEPRDRTPEEPEQHLAPNEEHMPAVDPAPVPAAPEAGNPEPILAAAAPAGPVAVELGDTEKVEPVGSPAGGAESPAPASDGTDERASDQQEPALPEPMPRMMDAFRRDLGTLSVQGEAQGRFGPAKALPLRRAEPPPLPPLPDTAASRLSTMERSAFREIARALGARFEDELSSSGASPQEGPKAAEPGATAPQPTPDDLIQLLDRLPAGVLVHRGDEALFANRLLLDLVDYASLGDLTAAGGVPRLFKGRTATLARHQDGVSAVALSTSGGETVPVEVRLSTVPWVGLPAGLMLIRRLPENDAVQRLRALELDLRAREARLRELSAVLDTATDGFVVIDDEGRILSLNRSAEALFGYDQNEVAGEPITVLLAVESHGTALDYLDGLRGNGVASLLNDGREVMGRVRQGGAIPLFMTLGRIQDAHERRFCAVLRDVTAFKKAEGELLQAKRAAEEASAQKSDFLARISHEVRTPLNAIIGFAEVMLEERFGPVGSERYKEYLKDIHASGGHVISLVNDLLDLAKIEAGRMELSFTSVGLNELVASCVTLMQPQAARERIVMRTSLAGRLPPIVADERSLRQIALNIVSNAIKFTDAGGQVIVSTALTDRGEVALRVRDTGIGMTGEEIEAALEPFRQVTATRRGNGTGLGLPLTKALVEANRGALKLTSARDEGTLVEVVFPPTRVLAD